MKKILYLIIAAALLASCDGFLTKLPETDLSPESYFSTEPELELWTNRYYGLLTDEDDATDVYDDCNFSTSTSSLQKGTRTSSAASWSWTNLRYINLLFENSNKCNEIPVRTKYEGVAHFFRALFYYEKVRQLGDVPYYDFVIQSDDAAALNRPRDSRGYVMKKILADLDSAAVKLPAAWSSQPLYHVSSYAALALKSRVALFEGTFRKYHNIPNETVDGTVLSPEWFLSQAADAAQKVMSSGKYSLYKKSDKHLDPSMNTPYREYFTLADAESSETILSKRYSKELNVAHSLQFNFVSRRQSATRRFVNHYLYANGSPIQSKDNWETLSYKEMFDGRDPRLAQTIQGPGYKAEGATTAQALNLGYTVSGYRVIKYICSDAKNQGSTSETDFPYLRYAEVLLNYAEAKAELGELTNADVIATIDVIRERAGVAKLWTVPTTVDPLMRIYYPNASGTQLAAILEIRRERTVELFAEGQRLYDLLRWKEGKWITPSSTSGFQGIYIAALGEQDLDGNGQPDAYFYKGAGKPAGISGSIPASNIIRIGTDITLSNGNSGYLVYYGTENYVWNEDKDYLWPIPLGQIQATAGALTQNPGYEDIGR
ncbi:MAG: RagB/SusD family nutrient uptake outer membrane protein [Bacteroidales bacterium]|nr:RagB/SusD family nutrient uptake outer membrane protein [Bacteroidales bacterium]